MDLNQRDRIRQGLLFTDLSEGLPEDRMRGKELVYDFNQTRPCEIEERQRIAKGLFGKIGDDFCIEPPVHFAYGSNIYVGNHLYANFNLTIVDDMDVFIGDHVLFAPNVVISTTGHPVHPELRNTGQMYSFSVTIEDNVWIGSGVIINPGVTIGRNSVIGAGSVVTKDVPSNVIAVGNPCRVLREITERDKEYYYKDLQVDRS